ncbi:nuclear transport factor 2 family protein [Actinomyces sp. MRS3W]|uniref:nuclear transport factor 2 family protein n=1 Tax=Actinomyces sp. MRS3W TaxID=2800796 RepID=UPI0028FD869E|nr:nuclear transport factor 2 family protein [Actinomyces sp. MRS3W]MDU0347566.1 nuclear transport factor 2 family protein [Actinomyces sp. MRS3W]
MTATTTRTGNLRTDFEAFVDLFYRHKRVREAFEFLVAEDYVQHNPGIADGRESAIVALTPKFDGSPENTFEVLRILLDGNLGMVHVRAKHPGSPDGAVADIYRFEDGLIVEHWDVLQSVPATSANPHPMF